VQDVVDEIIQNQKLKVAVKYREDIIQNPVEK
jgi:hypothetical protein